MRFALAFVALIVCGSASAQQQLSPEQMAATSLGQQIGQLALQNFVLQAKLEAAQARVKELEAKTCSPEK